MKERMVGGPGMKRWFMKGLNEITLVDGGNTRNE